MSDPGKPLTLAEADELIDLWLAERSPDWLLPTLLATLDCSVDDLLHKLDLHTRREQP